MRKDTIIKKIKTIIENYGSFGSGELTINNSPCVNSMGNIVALAEYFNHTTVEIKSYNTSSFSSDEIDSYEEKYEDLPKDVLSEILLVCEEYEVEQIKTEKRISN